MVKKKRIGYYRRRDGTPVTSHWRSLPEFPRKAYNWYNRRPETARFLLETFGAYKAGQYTGDKIPIIVDERTSDGKLKLLTHKDLIKIINYVPEALLGYEIVTGRRTGHIAKSYAFQKGFKDIFNQRSRAAYQYSRGYR